jgi:hypothetical protein
MKQPWQKNKVVIVATYTQEFIDYLKELGQRPGLIKARYEGKKYNVAPGKPCRIPVIVATAIEKYPYIESVVEVK